MTKYKTANLSVATNLTKLGKLVFIFKPDPKFPWIVPILQRQYEMDFCAEYFLERRLKDPNDESTVYKTSTSDIKQYVINPYFFKMTCWLQLHKKTSNTTLPIPDNIKDDDIAQTADELHKDLVQEIFDRNF